MADYSFSELVEKLTIGWHEFVDTDDGQVLTTSDGLLERIREAVFGGASGGGGTQGKAKLPLDATALDILNEIDRQAAEVLAAADPRPTPYGTTESYVSLWSALVDAETPVVVTSRETVGDHIDMGSQPRVFSARVETTAFELVAGWVNRIESYFAPATISEPIPAPCPVPECGERYALRQVDGVTMRSDALSNSIERETRKLLGANCGACGKHWEVEELPRLAVLCGFTPDPEAVAMFLHGTPKETVAPRS